MDNNKDEIIEKLEILLEAKDENIDILEKTVAVQEEQIKVLKDIVERLEGDKHVSGI